MMDSVVSETANITTSSGIVELTLVKVPSAEIYTSSGTVNLLLANGGAEVLYTTNSGKLITDRVYDRKATCMCLTKVQAMSQLKPQTETLKFSKGELNEIT